MTRRIVLATALLIVGVAMVGVAAETGMIVPSIIGYLLLMFVPALTIDAAAKDWKRRKGLE